MQIATQVIPQTKSASLAAEQHALPLSILLHLLPGAIVTLCYILLVPPLLAMGINNLITLNLLALTVLVPIELGILYRAGLLQNGKASLKGIVLYREKLPAWQLIVLALITLFWIGLVSLTLTKVFDPLIQKNLFGWLPAWFPLDTNFSAMPRGSLIATLATSLVCTSWLGPVVEELYFRGFLLPRLSRFGAWAPVINGILFTLYHFFTPWAFVERVIMVIPMAWLVQKKRNIFITIIAHLLLNTLGILPMLIKTILK
jgi:membrane protease YdiL (CAAX protease family)